MKRKQDTRVTITLKLSRKVLATLLLSIPREVHLENWKDIVMWHNQSALRNLGLMDEVSANKILMDRGFYPRELKDKKLEVMTDKSNTDSKLIQNIMKELGS